MWDIPDKVANSGVSLAGKHTHGEFNNRQHELEKAVTHTGVALTTYPADPNATSDANEAALAESISRAASLGLYATDGGAANAYVLSITGSVVAPKALFDGLSVRVAPAHTNTTASTANVFGLGIKAIRTWDDAALTGGELVINRPTSLRYKSTANSGNGAWLIDPWAVPVASTGGPVYAGLDSGSANAHVVGQDGALPVLPALVDGVILSYLPATTNTSAVTVNAFALGVKSIVDWKGNALTAGKFVAGQPTMMSYSSSLGKWVLLPWAEARAKYATLTGTITSVANTQVSCSNFTNAASNMPNSTISGSGITIGAGDEGVYQLSAGLQPTVNGTSLGVTISIGGVGAWSAYDTSSTATSIAVSTSGVSRLSVGSVLTLQGAFSVGSNVMNCSLSIVRIGGL